MLILQQPFLTLQPKPKQIMILLATQGQDLNPACKATPFAWGVVVALTKDRGGVPEIKTSVEKKIRYRESLII